MTPEEIKAAVAAAMATGMEGLQKNIAANVEKAVGEVKTEFGAIKADLDAVKAARIEEEKKAKEEAANLAASTAAADLKAAQEKATKAEKDLADFKAAQEAKEAEKAKEEPARKTFSAAQLLAKYGGKADEGSEATIADVIASIDKLDLSASESMRLKMKARAELGTKESV